MIVCVRTLKTLMYMWKVNLQKHNPNSIIKFTLSYEFKGKNLPLEKLKKAVNLSEESYCGVSAVYRKVMEVTSEIRVVE